MPPKKKLYGGETAKAVDNFPISGETVPPSVIHWLGRIKGAAARVNGELGLIDKDLAAKISTAAEAVARGDHDDQFPIDVFQTGSGTSSNMNTNEVLGTLSGAHPNDHVNYGQSSNDVFPSAVHLAALDEATNTLLPALKQLERSFTKKANQFKDVVKSGRTHLMDAVPVTLGQEFAGYAAQIRLGQERIESALVHVGQLPLGGTATGTGLNTHPQFAEKVRKDLAKASKLKLIAPPADPFEAQANRDALVELSGALKVVAVSLTKIAQDLALMGSGPRAGIGELFLPELQKGSSIMPGKVNPVIPEVVLQVAAQVIGNDTAITIGGMQGQFELNVRIPLIARNLLQSIQLLSTTSVAFAEKCVDGLKANRAGCERSAGATLAVATALNTAIGYDKAAAIVKTAADSGRPLRDVALEQGVDPELYDETIDLRRIAAGNQAQTAAPKAKPAPAKRVAAKARTAAAKAPAKAKTAAAKAAREGEDRLQRQAGRRAPPARQGLGASCSGRRDGCGARRAPARLPGAWPGGGQPSPPRRRPSCSRRPRVRRRSPARSRRPGRPRRSSSSTTSGSSSASPRRTPASSSARPPRRAPSPMPASASSARATSPRRSRATARRSSARRRSAAPPRGAADPRPPPG